MRTYWKEFLGHSSTVVILLLAVLCGAAVVAESGRWEMWVAVAVGAVLFFVTEYTTHRFLFHRKPPRNERLLRFLKRIHYDHHEVPNELDLLFLPVWYSVPNNTLLLGLAWVVTGSWTIALGVVFGALVALLYYEWVHYVAHRPIKPRTAWGRWMKKVHQWHHYKNEKYWFGVTNPSMDVVMGTWREENDVELSPTARKLLGK